MTGLPAALQSALPVVAALLTVGGAASWIVAVQHDDGTPARDLELLLLALLVFPLTLYGVLSLVAVRFGWPRNFFYAIFPMFLLQVTLVERVVRRPAVRRALLAPYLCAVALHGLPASLHAWTVYDVDRSLVRAAAARSEDAVILPWASWSEAILQYYAEPLAAGPGPHPRLVPVLRGVDLLRVIPPHETSFALIAPPDYPAPATLSSRGVSHRLESSEPIAIPCFSYLGLAGCPGGSRAFVVHRYVVVRDRAGIG